MIKIITFLGGGAVETSYQFEDGVYTGNVFAEALHKFCKYDEMLVCVTEKAKEKTWPHQQSAPSIKIILSNIDKFRQLLHELVEYWDLKD